MLVIIYLLLAIVVAYGFYFVYLNTVYPPEVLPNKMVKFYLWLGLGWLNKVGLGDWASCQIKAFIWEVALYPTLVLTLLVSLMLWRSSKRGHRLLVERLKEKDKELAEVRGALRDAQASLRNVLNEQQSRWQDFTLKALSVVRGQLPEAVSEISVEELPLPQSPALKPPEQRQG